jgi:hypothetical protein
VNSTLHCCPYHSAYRLNQIFYKAKEKMVAPPQSLRNVLCLLNHASSFEFTKSKPDVCRSVNFTRSILYLDQIWLTSLAGSICRHHLRLKPRLLSPRYCKLILTNGRTITNVFSSKHDMSTTFITQFYSRILHFRITF